MLRNYLIAPILLSLCLFPLGCETYIGRSDQALDLATDALHRTFPWSHNCKNEEEKLPAMETESEPFDRYFFKNTRSVLSTVPCTNDDVLIYIEPDGRLHITARVYEACLIHHEAYRRGYEIPIYLPTTIREVTARGVALFNRRLAYEDFELTEENVHEWVWNLLSMTHQGHLLVDDSLSFIHYLPPGYKYETDLSPAEMKMPWWERAAKKVHPLTIRLKDGMYHIHFYSYGPDIKSWKIIARPDGTIHDYEMTYPFGMYNDERFFEDM